MWVCYAIGVFMGVATIGIASPVAQETIRLDATTAAFSVSIFAIFNGASRPFFGWLTDWVKPKKAAIASYTLSLIASILMIQYQPRRCSYLPGCLFPICLWVWGLACFSTNRYPQPIFISKLCPQLWHHLRSLRRRGCCRYADCRAMSGFIWQLQRLLLSHLGSIDCGDSLGNLHAQSPTSTPQRTTIC
uniref:Uncharacterized protein n=1 Tax=Desertifilum tharense IPPAS B-1220 TaxID=1781255 RepID=A0ACD5GRS1_9CYAN